MARAERWNAPKNNKRGTAMVEAAIVFPLTIAAIMAMIYMMINIYCLTALKSHIHVTLRAEAGERTALTESLIEDGRGRDRYRRAMESRRLSVESRENILRPYISAEREIVYKANSIVNGTARRKSAGRVYLIDEVKNLRNIGALTGLFGSENDGG